MRTRKKVWTVTISASGIVTHHLVTATEMPVALKRALERRALTRNFGKAWIAPTLVAIQLESGDKAYLDRQE